MNTSEHVGEGGGDVFAKSPTGISDEPHQNVDAMSISQASFQDTLSETGSQTLNTPSSSSAKPHESSSNINQSHDACSQTVEPPVSNFDTIQVDTAIISMKRASDSSRLLDDSQSVKRFLRDSSSITSYSQQLTYVCNSLQPSSMTVDPQINETVIPIEKCTSETKLSTSQAHHPVALCKYCSSTEDSTGSIDNTNNKPNKAAAEIINSTKKNAIEDAAKPSNQDEKKDFFNQRAFGVGVTQGPKTSQHLMSSDFLLENKRYEPKHNLRHLARLQLQLRL